MRTINAEDYRNYQVDARDAAFAEFRSGSSSTLVVMPTGTGKTVLAGMCVEEARARDRRALFLAHREVLIEQAYKTLCRFGLDCAVEMGPQDARKHASTFGPLDAVVGSVQTLQDDRLMRWSPNEFGLIIIDECHRSLAPSYTKILNWFEGYDLLGITATPRRGDERNLGARFQTKAFEYTLRQAIADQWLAPIKVRECQVTVDLRGIKLFGGDFSVGELEERIGPRIEQLARGFLKECGSRPAVVFTPDVGSAMAFAQVCSDLGTPARYVAGSGGTFGMTKAERKANLEAFNAGAFQVISCCELLIEGWDCPKVECVGILRPTKQQYRYAQMVGRGTRPSPDTGKVDCLVVDFDWETEKDSKDLCSSVDLFNDGTLDEDVFAEAKRIAGERAVDVDPIDVIEEAEKIVETRQRFNIILSGQEATYASMEYDPIGVSQLLGIKLSRKYDFDKRGDNPATPGQLRFLAALGVSAPEGLSKWGASKMIDKLQKRKSDGLASARQVSTLLSVGITEMVARGMSSEQASQTIKDTEILRPKVQRSLFV